MTRDEYTQACDYLLSLLLPTDVAVNFNGERLQSRKPLHTFEASLETVVADEEGVMRSRTRKTTVSIYEALQVTVLVSHGIQTAARSDRNQISAPDAPAPECP